MIYYYIRKLLKIFCCLTKQQCSGKRKSGFALEWCKLRAFHDGPCINFQDEVFTDNR